MKTVKELQAELAKFPDAAICYAYEGVDTGIVIRENERLRGKYGFIPCSAYDDTKLNTKTL